MHAPSVIRFDLPLLGHNSERCRQAHGSPSCLWLSKMHFKFILLLVTGRENGLDLVMAGLVGEVHDSLRFGPIELICDLRRLFELKHVGSVVVERHVIVVVMLAGRRGITWELKVQQVIVL